MWQPTFVLASGLALRIVVCANSETLLMGEAIQYTNQDGLDIASEGACAIQDAAEAAGLLSDVPDIDGVFSAWHGGRYGLTAHGQGGMVAVQIMACGSEEGEFFYASDVVLVGAEAELVSRIVAAGVEAMGDTTMAMRALPHPMPDRAGVPVTAAQFIDRSVQLACWLAERISTSLAGDDASTVRISPPVSLVGCSPISWRWRHVPLCHRREGLPIRRAWLFGSNAVLMLVMGGTITSAGLTPNSSYALGPGMSPYHGAGQAPWVHLIPATVAAVEHRLADRRAEVAL
jgi:hypothetical protein